MAANLPMDVDDEDYNSSQDSDFALDDASRPGNDRSDSDDDDDNDDSAEPASRRRHRNDATPQDADDYNNSGDEAIIKKGRKRRKLAQAKDGARDDEVEEGGGLIKTRRQRAAEREQRRELATSTARVTIDVDAVWAEMMAAGSVAAARTRDAAGEDGRAAGGEDANANAKGAGTDGNEDGIKPAATTTADEGGEAGMVRIKRTYNFAGRVHTEEKLVPRDSAEAKLYLAATGDDAAARPRIKRAFRSRFEPPMADGAIARPDLDLGLTARMKAAKEAQARKLTTVEKSRMDWAGYVDKEGIKDELELAGRSKDSYAARQDFLARSEAMRESEAKRARLAGRK
ncbi:SWR1-complex protein 5 [Escovopsis weberi]|uniref:SWR1-complex protein 5 n=1 Tax=Escovopsis weberi TaxID=150374 RepID=A0A0M8N1L8_ESCWE|nr:SWR1-complex protein 5 [Escovopsis weberi]